MKYRFYNKSAVKEGYPKEEYCSEWYSSYNAAVKFMFMQMNIDSALDISDEYEIETDEH